MYPKHPTVLSLHTLKSEENQSLTTSGVVGYTSSTLGEGFGYGPGLDR
jgi:hypothetical protein